MTEPYNGYFCEDCGKGPAYPREKPNRVKCVACEPLPPSRELTADELRKEQAIRKKVSATRTLAGVMANGIPETSWIVEGILPARGITVIGGSPGSYKSYIAQHLALCVTTGQRFLDKFPTEQVNVLYLDEENGLVLLAHRFGQLARGSGQTTYPENLRLLVFSDVRLDDPESEMLLDALVIQYGIKLFVLDSMVRLLKGDENKASDVRLAFDHIKNVMEREGVSFVILHHTRKPDPKKGKSNGMDALRGSSDFGAFADVVLMLDSKERDLIMSVAKNRHQDLRGLSDYRVCVTNPGEDGIKFALVGELARKKDTQADLCRKAILAWGRTQARFDPFGVKELHSALESLGYRKTIRYDAIHSLEEDGLLNFVGGGKYQFTPGVLSSVNEDSAR